MARIARVVAPGVPHHITQRGNRRQEVFFSDDDYSEYLHLLAEWSEKAALRIVAYCLMPNHVHVIAIPEVENSLHLAFKETHRRYSCRINLRQGWRGYLWQGRFASYPMDESYTHCALSYVENNPVRAGLAAVPEDWRWSSAATRRSKTSTTSPVKLAILHSPSTSQDSLVVLEEVFRQHERTGRPLGDEHFLNFLEDKCQRILKPLRRGPKPKDKS